MPLRKPIWINVFIAINRHTLWRKCPLTSYIPFYRGSKLLGVTPNLPELAARCTSFRVRDDVHERADHNITYEERPPMIAIPAYREKYYLDQQHND